MRNVTGIGGGHGLSALLQALKPWDGNLTAIVSVADNGGSSGRLRGHYLMPSPGDVRRCLLALASEDNIAASIADHRFSSRFGPDWDDHSLGNLILAALTERYDGDFAAAVAQAHILWNVRGRVLPVTGTALTLCARTYSGEIVRGEREITEQGALIAEVWLDPPNSIPAPGVYDALTAADLILVGPGSLYSSIIAPLLVPGVAGAIRNSPARKAYVCNLTEQAGETAGYTAGDHIEAIERHVGRNLFDFVLVNTRTPAEGCAEPFVVADIPAVAFHDVMPVTGRYWESPNTDRYADLRIRKFVEWLLSDAATERLARWRQTRTTDDLPEFETVSYRIR